MEDKTSNNTNKDPNRRKKKKKKKIISDAVRSPVSLGDPELNDIFAKIYKMKDDLDSKFSHIREMTGMSGTEISTYLNNPNNFTPFQWKQMESDKKLAEERLYLGLGHGTKERRAKKVSEKQAKERRGKMLGARKKWLQM
jgi:hypothetical protein